MTEKCDLDCFYCHNEGCNESESEMNPKEIGDLVNIATEYGIEKVKLTGGEPLARKDIIEIVSAISQPKITDVSITTNGVKLYKKAFELKKSGLDRVNISLDTLDSEKYEKITGKPYLDKVLEGIDKAIEAGLYPIKLNTIVMKGINEDEIEKLIEYSVEKGVILQLIELEKVLPENKEIYEKYHRDLDDIEERVKKRSTEVRTRWLMQARRKYMLENGGEIEIINPMHNSEFCSHCTRLRMTSGGQLKPCLMRNDNLVDAITPLRNDNMEKVREAYETAIERREPYFTRD